MPVAAAAPSVILFAAFQLWSGRRRAQYFAMRSELLEQFQAPGIQDWLTRDPNFLIEPVRQNAAIVFIDLSGFTSLSERLGPDRIRELLKDFHALVDKEAVGCGGMITSFLGDGAMILFGLPKAASDDAFRAADCSVRTLRQRRAMADLSARIDRVTTWIQGRRAFRNDRRLQARRRKLSPRHSDGRHGQCGEPPDGGGGQSWRPACGEQRVAPCRGTGLFGIQLGRPCGAK